MIEEIRPSKKEMEAVFTRAHAVVANLPRWIDDGPRKRMAREIRAVLGVDESVSDVDVVRRVAEVFKFKLTEKNTAIPVKVVTDSQSALGFSGDEEK